MVHGAFPGGGSLALAELIDRHGEAIEATLAGFGVDLYDVVRGKVPASKVLRLLRWTPPDSPFRASVSGGPERIGWTGHMGVAADVWDLLASVYTAKGKPPEHPRYGKGKRGGSNLGQMMRDRLGKGRDRG